MHSLGIYVQVPFCASKCSFCNFSSRVERPGVFTQYCRALQREIVQAPAHYQALGAAKGLLALPVDTIYFGGGTPSLLGAERLEKVVGALHGALRVQDAVEFTLEVTPGSADRQFLARALAMGINRLSIGAQTFEDRELRAVGRLHSALDTRELVQAARAAGFTNLSIDLVAGLPHQNPGSWRNSLEAALRLAPRHISLYLFEIDEKSRLGREVMQGGSRYHASTVPGQEFMADAYECGRERLGREGYIHYEISNFALPDYESKHNLKYWRLAPYLGLGAGAHSFDGNCRWSNVDSAGTYVNELAGGRTPVAEVRRIPPREQLEEFFFLGLRQAAGVSLEAARKRWGEELLGPWKPKIQSLTQDGLLTASGDNFRLAETAYLVSNEVFQEFV